MGVESVVPACPAGLVESVVPACPAGLAVNKQDFLKVKKRLKETINPLAGESPHFVKGFLTKPMLGPFLRKFMPPPWEIFYLVKGFHLRRLPFKGTF